MTPHLLPHSTNRRGFFCFAILRSLPDGLIRVLSVVIGLGAFVGVALADPPKATLPARPAGVTDAAAARSVLTAIDADPELRGVNLVVSVVDGVAVIGGPVPSAAVAKHAEEVVRKIPEIKDVRNGCYVAVGPDPLLKAVADRLGSSPLPRPSTTELPGVLTGPQQPAWGPPPSAGFQNPNLVASAQPANTVVARKPDGLGVLGAPVKPAGPGSVAGAGGRDSFTVPSIAPGMLTGMPSQNSVNDILTSASNVKKVEARFAKLTVEMRDGTLVIGGSAPRASDAWDLGEKLRQIPGVSRVVIATTPMK